MTTVQVHVYAQAPADEPDAVERAYHVISARLAGTPGLLHNRLLADQRTPGRYLVVSEWASPAAFQVWEQGPDHRVQTEPLRPYLDFRSSGQVFHVLAAYQEIDA